MGLLGEFEQRLERAVEGFFARVFRSGVHPVEIGKRLLRVMEDGKTLGLKRTYVPNVYKITLSAKDYERLAPLEARLVEDMEVFITEAAQQRGWVLADSPSVSFASGARLSPGEFRIDAEAVAVPAGRVKPEERPAAVPQERPAAVPAAVQANDGSGRFSLVVMGDHGPVDSVAVRGTIRIGRQADNDLVINDPGVSRHHARVVEGNGSVVLQDLGSTNGTIVNGAQVREHRLSHGDRMVLGQTVIEFRRA